MNASIPCQRFDIEAAGRRLHAQRIEPVGVRGPTLVFLHEGLGSIGQWKDFPTQLCQACALPGLVYERWGFGRSEPLTEPRRTDYLHYEALDSLPAVLERCGIVEPPILIGHSHWRSCSGSSTGFVTRALSDGRETGHRLWFWWWLDFLVLYF